MQISETSDGCPSVWMSFHGGFKEVAEVTRRKVMYVVGVDAHRGDDRDGSDHVLPRRTDEVQQGLEVDQMLYRVEADSHVDVERRMP